MQNATMPLEGITIADFSWVLAGPRATEHLGAMGARVIKIEGPYHPDQFRSSPVEIPGADSEKYSATFWSLNYSKLGCTIDINKPKGRQLALEVVKRSDVVLENYAYGMMDRVGLTYDDLREVRPDIIMVSGSAIGKSGPDKKYVTYGSLLHAFSGLNDVTGYEGEEPGTLGGTFSDPVTGATMALAILGALWYRKRTGKGQYIDLSMAETTMAQIPEFFMDYSVNGRLSGPQGNREEGSAPHNSYPCKDGEWLAIAVRDQQEWEALCVAIGEPEWTKDPLFSDQYCRWNNRQELDKLIQVWTRQQTASEAMTSLQRAGVPAGVCYNSKGIFEDPHHNARGMFVELEQEIVGRKPIVRLPWLLNPGPNGRYFPAPMLGEHNDLVFRDLLGLSEAEMEDLRTSKVIL